MPDKKAPLATGQPLSIEAWRQNHNLTTMRCRCGCGMKPNIIVSTFEYPSKQPFIEAACISAGRYLIESAHEFGFAVVHETLHQLYAIEDLCNQ